MLTTKLITFQIVQLMGLITALIGVLTIAGYISGSPILYTWNTAHPMAINTSICVIFSGASTFLLGRGMYHKVNKS